MVGKSNKNRTGQSARGKVTNTATNKRIEPKDDELDRKTDDCGRDTAVAVHGPKARKSLSAGSVSLRPTSDQCGSHAHSFSAHPPVVADRCARAFLFFCFVFYHFLPFSFDHVGAVISCCCCCCFAVSRQCVRFVFYFPLVSSIRKEEN